MRTLDVNTLLEKDLFRRSYAKTVAILTNYFGLAQVEIAEDVVQDALVEAMERWSIQGIPKNPEGWIIEVSKKKAIDVFRRQNVYLSKVMPSLRALCAEGDHENKDSTLKMIFACCHPLLPKESQIALALKTLCGLSVSEIANALLTSVENINKRLYRAREKFRSQRIEFVTPEIDQAKDRIDSVCQTLYLLFNEGYYSPQYQHPIRTDLCYEAIRLLKEVESSFSRSSKVHGLLALMYLNMSRFESRLGEDNALVSLQDQDRSLWDQELIGLGVLHLNKSMEDHVPNKYQLQAGIAAEYCIARSFETINWGSVYSQYELLEALERSDLIYLNKQIAYFFLGNREEAFSRILQMTYDNDFKPNALHFLTLGVLSSYHGDEQKTSDYLGKALSLADSDKEKKLILARLGGR